MEFRSSVLSVGLEYSVIRMILLYPAFSSLSIISGLSSRVIVGELILDSGFALEIIGAWLGVILVRIACDTRSIMSS